MKTAHATAIVTALFVILLALAVLDIKNLYDTKQALDKFYLECPCKKGQLPNANDTYIGYVEVCNDTITGERIGVLPGSLFYGR